MKRTCTGCNEPIEFGWYLGRDGNDYHVDCVPVEAMRDNQRMPLKRSDPDIECGMPEFISMRGFAGYHRELLALTGKTLSELREDGGIHAELLYAAVQGWSGEDAISKEYPAAEELALWVFDHFRRPGVAVPIDR
jgi:hypothetical protein